MLQVDVVIALTLDEIMPRPKSGLLSRMMRLAPAPCLPGTPAEQPRFCLRPGAHYLVGIYVLNVPDTGTAFEPWRLKLHAPNGQAASLACNRAQPGNNISHVSAEWDPAQLVQGTLGARSEAEAPDAQQLVSLEAEIGLGKLDRPTDPSERWTIRLPVQIALSDRYAFTLIHTCTLQQS